MNPSSLQDRYAPQGGCFGCGPANAEGLQIKSHVEGDEVVCTWQPAPYHEAFPGVLCGGIIGTLLDCHCNWTGAWHLMRQMEAEKPPCTVTSEYAIKLLRPTPAAAPVILRAFLTDITDDRAIIEGRLEGGGKLCATCTGTFVAVKPGHPAYHRW